MLTCAGPVLHTGASPASSCASFQTAHSFPTSPPSTSAHAQTGPSRHQTLGSQDPHSSTSDGSVEALTAQMMHIGLGAATPDYPPLDMPSAHQEPADLTSTATPQSASPVLVFPRSALPTSRMVLQSGSSAAPSAASPAAESASYGLAADHEDRTPGSLSSSGHSQRQSMQSDLPAGVELRHEAFQVYTEPSPDPSCHSNSHVNICCSSSSSSSSHHSTVSTSSPDALSSPGSAQQSAPQTAISLDSSPESAASDSAVLTFTRSVPKRSSRQILSPSTGPPTSPRPRTILGESNALRAGDIHFSPGLGSLPQAGTAMHLL